MQRYLLEESIRYFQTNRQMLFMSGPRQVGKTTVAKKIGEIWKNSNYFDWDNLSHRKTIINGPDTVIKSIGIEQLSDRSPLMIFNEIHKYQHWRNFLKGLFDQYESAAKFLVIGSASLQVFSRGGDSLMGRYFPYTLHPVSVGECTNPNADELIDSLPKEIHPHTWDSLIKFGGFPEPFLRSEQRFHNRWQSLRTEHLFREDIRELTRIQEISQIEVLAEYLRLQVGQLTSYSSLARKVQVSVDTIRRWISTLESLYYCFKLKPWHRNVVRALRKEPKYYLWDWSLVSDSGARYENLVASALLKSVHWWTETGLGHFDLHFVRDKQKNEVDFLVTRDKTPWFAMKLYGCLYTRTCNS